MTAGDSTAIGSKAAGGADPVAVAGKVALYPHALGTAVSVVHLIQAVSIAGTVRIILKKAYLARRFRLDRHRRDGAFQVSSEGPGRGGTFQISTCIPVVIGQFRRNNTSTVGSFSQRAEKVQSHVQEETSHQGEVHLMAGGNIAQSSSLH